jgi:hypothetical protein
MPPNHAGTDPSASERLDPRLPIPCGTRWRGVPARRWPVAGDCSQSREGGCFPRPLPLPRRPPGPSPRGPAPTTKKVAAPLVAGVSVVRFPAWNLIRTRGRLQSLGSSESSTVTASAKRRQRSSRRLLTPSVTRSSTRSPSRLASSDTASSAFPSFPRARLRRAYAYDVDSPRAPERLCARSVSAPRAAVVASRVRRFAARHLIQNQLHGSDGRRDESRARRGPPPRAGRRHRGAGRFDRPRRRRACPQARAETTRNRPPAR